MEDVQKKEPFSQILFVEDYWFVAGLLVDRQLLGPAPFILCYLAAVSSPTLQLAASGACRVVLVGAASPLLACLGWGGWLVAQALRSSSAIVRRVMETIVSPASEIQHLPK